MDSWTDTQTNRQIFSHYNIDILIFKTFFNKRRPGELFVTLFIDLIFGIMHTIDKCKHNFLQSKLIIDFFAVNKPLKYKVSEK